MQDLRIGHGFDLHRLQPGGRLMVGGVEVGRDLSTVAHSDGDVALHALVDALLGAAGLPDIGERFPNTDLRWKGSPGRLFVEAVMADLRGRGWRVANADLTILAERPKLAPFKADIARAVAGLLDIDPSAVGVKAGTNEGCDAVGRGEAIAAHAVVLLIRLS
jgi:2-C-methyl-D-erythritol 2,4-cyclodiphosphate synthase